MNPTRAPSRNSRASAIGLTVTAIVLAGGTTLLAVRMLTAGGYSNEPTRPVVVAAEQRMAGEPLTRAALKVVLWPASSIPKDAFANVDQLLTPAPRVPTIGLTSGEPILRSRLASADAGPGLAALVKPGQRAVVVRVDREVAAAHLLYPGARVDVVATLLEAVHRAVTRTVIDDVRVLAVGSFADIDAARRGTAERRSSTGMTSAAESAEAVVTLEVSAENAERLLLAARQGKIDLVLRSGTDHAPAGTPGITTPELFSARATAPRGDALALPADSAHSSADKPARGLRRRSHRPPTIAGRPPQETEEGGARALVPLPRSSQPYKGLKVYDVVREQ